MEKHKNITENKYFEYFGSWWVEKRQNAWKVPCTEKQKDITRSVY